MDNRKAMLVLTQAYGLSVDPDQAYLEVQHQSRYPGPLKDLLEQAYGTTIQALARYAELNWPSSTH